MHSMRTGKVPDGKEALLSYVYHAPAPQEGPVMRYRVDKSISGWRVRGFQGMFVMWTSWFDTRKEAQAWTAARRGKRG